MGSIPYYVKLAMFVAACVAILFVILDQMGIAIPHFIVLICWILGALFLGLVAVNIAMKMFGSPPPQ